MLDQLARVEKVLPDWLRVRTDWNSLFIDYRTPFVERLWLQDGPYRVFLHRVHPCAFQRAFYHPHPWPSAMWVVAGGPYECAVGFGPPSGEPPSHAATFIARPPLFYEMTDPNGWHYVRPIGDPVYTIMVTGPVWKRRSGPKPDHQLKPLPEKDIADLKGAFGRFLEEHKNKVTSPSYIMGARK